jgi:flagellar assembly factor FliW
MVLQTKYFGELTIKESDILHFGHGLPGFETVTRFVLVDNEEEDSPFKWLQGIDEPKPAFVLVNPFLIRKDYEVNLDDDVLKELDIREPESASVYCIVVVPEDINKMTVNLQAPLVINNVKNLGRQLILDTDRYGVRHYILEELQKWEGTENVGTDEKKGSIDNHK